METAKVTMTHVIDWLCYAAAAVGLVLYAPFLLPPYAEKTREGLAGAGLILGLHVTLSGRVFGWW